MSLGKEILGNRSVVDAFKNASRRARIRDFDAIQAQQAEPLTVEDPVIDYLLHFASDGTLKGLKIKPKDVIEWTKSLASGDTPQEFESVADLEAQLMTNLSPKAYERIKKAMIKHSLSDSS